MFIEVEAARRLSVDEIMSNSVAAVAELALVFKSTLDDEFSHTDSIVGLFGSLFRLFVSFREAFRHVKLATLIYSTHL